MPLPSPAHGADMVRMASAPATAAAAAAAAAASPPTPHVDDLLTGPYVVALHDFTSSIPTCLSFSAGQRIRILNFDESGWWDGVLPAPPGQDEPRGWFPSNYVDTSGLTNSRPSSRAVSQRSWAPGPSDDQRYDSDYSTVVRGHLALLRDIDRDQSHNILDTLDHAISLLDAAVEVHRFKHLQPATACIISSVRSILAATDCLTRDSPALIEHPSLRKDRKQILSALNRLVTQSRKACDPSPATDDAQRAHEADNMISLADELHQCVTLFLDTASTAGLDIPPNVSLTGRDPRGTAGSRPNRSHRLLQRRGGPKSMLELRATKQSQEPTESSPVPPTTPLTQSSSPPSPPISEAALPPQQAATSPANNMELTIPVYYPVTEILKRLNEANDHLLEQIAAFIGHAHSYSLPGGASSTYLIDRTREVVDAVRSLFLVVEAVHSNEQLGMAKAREMDLLFETRESLYASTSVLVDATRALTSSRDQNEEHDAAPSVPIPQSTELVTAATGVLRTGGECVGAVKLCLDKGDTALRILMYKTVPYHDGDANVGRHTSLSRRAASLNLLSSRFHSDGASTLDGLDTDIESDFDGMTDGGSTSILRDDNHYGGLDLLDVRQRSRSIGAAAHGAGSSVDADPGGRARSATVAGGIASGGGSLRVKAMAGRPAATDALRLGNHPNDKMASASSLSLTTAVSSPSDRGRPRQSSLASSIAPSWRNSRTPLFTGARGGSESLSTGVDEASSAGTKGRSRSATGESVFQPAVGASQDLPHWMGPNYDPSDVVYNSENHVMGATMACLVEKMTPHDSTVDPMFAQTFFRCFRFFVRPIELFTALATRYTLPPPIDLELTEQELQLWQQRKTFPVRLRIINSLRTWLDQYWYPWCDCEILEPLLAFTDKVDEAPLQRAMGRVKDLALKRRAMGTRAEAVMVLSASRGAHSLTRVIFPADAVGRREAVAQQQLIELRDMYRVEAFQLQQGSGQGSPPLAPIISHKLLQTLRTQPVERVSVLEFDPAELARQLTIKESKLFCAILPEEMYGNEFAKVLGETRSFHVKSLSAMSNAIVEWVVNSILGEEDPKRRRELLKFFIKLGDRCYRMNNFDVLMSIHNAINSSTILRLTKIWDGLGAKYRAMNDQQQRLLELSRNFHSYRQKIKQTNPPAIPYLGMYLLDLTFVWDGNAASRASRTDPDKKLINFDRYVKTSRVVSDLQRFQVPYRYTEVPEIQTYLDSVIVVPPEYRALLDQMSSDGPYNHSMPMGSRLVNSSSQGQVSPAASQGWEETPLSPTSQASLASAATTFAPKHSAPPSPPPASGPGLQRSLGGAPGPSHQPQLQTQTPVLQQVSSGSNLTWPARANLFGTRRKDTKTSS